MSILVLENELSSLKDRLITVSGPAFPKNKELLVPIFQVIQGLSFVGITLYQDY